MQERLLRFLGCSLQTTMKLCLVEWDMPQMICLVCGSGHDLKEADIAARSRLGRSRTRTQAAFWTARCPSRTPLPRTQPAQARRSTYRLGYGRRCMRSVMAPASSKDVLRALGSMSMQDWPTACWAV
jgi:hypothetical protein